MEVKKQCSSQKNAYYAQVGVLTLVRKETETVRHFVFKVHHSVEKGWCNGNDSTINFKCKERFTKYLPENLAKKKQVKHTIAVLEASIPFPALVKLVDVEDIADDKTVLMIILLKESALPTNCNHRT